MDFNYLKEIRQLYEKSNKLEEIIFVLGNNTCDMDSTLSAYLLSIGKNIRQGTIHFDKKKKPWINTEARILYLPVLNIKRGTLPHRIDIKYALNEFGVNEDDFWYISDEIFNPNNLFKYGSNLQNIKTSIILVDHALLIEEERYLSDYVIGIYDHHLLTNYNGLYKNLKTMNIVYPIGSTTTLILSEFFNDDDFPEKIISPVLALSAILLDTKKFKEELYENRWVDLDKKIYKKIKSQRKKNKSEKMGMKKYYKLLTEIKHDVEKNLDLGIDALFSKDQKFFNWNNIKAIWSSLPVNLNLITKKYGEKQIINYYLDNYKDKNSEEKKNTLFITNSSLDNNKKLFTIYNIEKLPFSKEELKNELINHSPKDFDSIDISKVFGENEKPEGELCNIILSETYSRKSLEPILKSFFSK